MAAPSVFVCVQCNKSYSSKDNLTRHAKIHNAAQVAHSCGLCDKTFTRKANLRKHQKKIHAQDQAVIQLANNIIAPAIPAGPSNASTNDWSDDGNDDFLDELMDGVESAVLCGNTGKRSNGDTSVAGKQKKARLDLVGDASVFTRVGSSFNNTIAWYYRKNTGNIFNYSSFLTSIKTELLNILKSADLPIKFNLKLEATYNRPHVENSFVNRAFKTSARAIFADSNIEELIDHMFMNILTEEEVHQDKGSGFSLQNIDGILLGVYKYTPLTGSSYIPLPSNIANKKAVINPQNDDQQCFKWAILAKYVSGDSKHRIGENYTEHEYKYNFTGLKFPTPFNEVKHFEKNNPHVSINIYGLNQEKEDKKVYHTVFPIKVVEEDKADHFDLLLLTDNEKSHYVYISNFSRLVSAQNTKHEHISYFCKKCFTSFDNQPNKYKPYGKEALEQHKKICGEHKPILPKMPTEGTTIEFEAWGKTQRHPVVIYADFEALLMKCEEKKGEKTVAFQTHKPMSYGFLVKAAEDIPVDLLEKFEIPLSPVIYRGSTSQEEVAEHFMHAIVDVARKIEKLFKTNIPIYFENGEEEKHIAYTACNLCKNEFVKNNVKTADHDHLTGKYRQTICSRCNMKLRKPTFVPCFIHNLSNYDAHFIIKELGYDVENISIIPNSEEKLISFSKYIASRFSLRFIDSCRFMASKLSTLAENLITSDYEKFRETKKFFKKKDMALVTRKGVYPYEYTDRWEVLEETALPSKISFYSTLTEEHIEEEEYEHAKEVWRHFECTTLGEYSDLYLTIDIFLLADIFENFRDVCMHTYNLDPAFYYTAPGLSFDAMLKCTSMKLELLTDYEMLLMFEKGIRGGLTQASMRHAKANNINTPDYDESKPSSWIIYQDCNNLYGWAMSQYMPYGGFKWVEPTLDGLETLTDTSDIGRVYEVDISYPQHLHNEHNDLPFLPENKKPPGSKIPKLVATFDRKTNYIIHYRNLKQALSYGLIVEKVHRVIQFNQSAWLSKYINMNTEMRKKASNDFEKDYWKLMNNSLFGKTMESMRKRISMELVSNEKKVKKLINNPTFKYCTTYSKNLAAITLDKKIINFCKPIYIGFTVLDISKTLMYDYNYSVMKTHYKDKATLMYTDTDSLIYHVETKDFYDDMKNNPILLDRMDTSDLPIDHPCFLSMRKKVPGFFSDELAGRTMTEFVALRAKSYAFSVNGKEKIKAKGIREHVVKHHMTLADHVKCLFNESDLKKNRENVSFRSFKHNLVTIRSNKLTFNNHDDKRCILDDQIHTLAHGHYLINEQMEFDD